MRTNAPFGDYRLTAYTVSCDGAEIRLRAERTEAGEPRHTEIVFTGVVAYHFEYDNFDTILSHVLEEPLATFLAEHAARFSAGSAEAGWARFWNGSVEDALRELEAASVHAYRITSAIGMRGWVLARSFVSQTLEA